MAEPAEAPSGVFDFVAMEHTILDFWSRGDLFRKSLEHTHDKKPYIFYDGPPFATGCRTTAICSPCTIKDIVPRYWTMRGRYVRAPLRLGLPRPADRSTGSEKQLGLSAQPDRRELGVAGFNAQCRSMVLSATSPSGARPSRAWGAGSTSTTTTRPWTPRSWSRCGGSFKQLWDKGLHLPGRTGHAV